MSTAGERAASDDNAFLRGLSVRLVCVLTTPVPRAALVVGKAMSASVRALPHAALDLWTSSSSTLTSLSERVGRGYYRGRSRSFPD
jgi:hypothetical protein